MSLCAHSSIIHNSQAMETIQMSIDRWTNKEIIYVHTEAGKRTQ